jgi:hypothetical protein
MYLTAPLGAMQNLQPPPVPNVPAVPPALQAAPPLLASAIATMLPSPAAKFNLSEPLIAPARNTPARISDNTSSGNKTAANENDIDPHALTFSLITKIERPILQKNNIGFATQLLAQENLAGISLPHTIHVADMLKRIADKSSHAAIYFSAEETSEESELPLFFRASAQEGGLRSILRRQVKGTVITARGTSAYLHALQRMPEYIPPAQEDAPEQ